MYIDTVMKDYIEKNDMTLKVHVYYSLGGYNSFTSINEVRGYYLSVTPVTIERNEKNQIVMERSVAFSGVKKLLIEVRRKSKRSEEQALQIAEQELESLIGYVLEKQAV